MSRWGKDTIAFENNDNLKNVAPKMYNLLKQIPFESIPFELKAEYRRVIAKAEGE